jgi:hypothetical protein
MDTAVLPENMSPSMPPEAGEAGFKADGYVLRHLLDLEARAAALVEDAQAEADRRLAEGEKLSRARYDETYAGEVAVLEAAYAKDIAAVKEDYKKQLDTYRGSLKAMPVDRGAFFALTEHLLFLTKEK